MNVKQGLIKYGEKVNHAIQKELQQFHDTKVLSCAPKRKMGWDN